MARSSWGCARARGEALALPLVRDRPISWPRAHSCSASFRTLLVVHRRSDSGSPYGRELVSALRARRGESLASDLALTSPGSLSALLEQPFAKPPATPTLSRYYTSRLNLKYFDSNVGFVSFRGCTAVCSGARKPKRLGESSRRWRAPRELGAAPPSCAAARRVRIAASTLPVRHRGSALR
jgi:hypothetical protein